MQRIYLLVEDDYINDFVAGFDRSKVTIIEENFVENQQLMSAELSDYMENKLITKSYLDSINNINSWLDEVKK